MSTYIHTLHTHTYISHTLTRVHESFEKTDSLTHEKRKGFHCCLCANTFVMTALWVACYCSTSFKFVQERPLSCLYLEDSSHSTE